MTERVFPKKCSNCRQRAMKLEEVPYKIQVDHDGHKYTLHFDALSVPKCSNCGAIFIDEEAGERISDKLREEAGLLKPEQIRAGRKKLGLSQQDFARLFGVAVATLSRWETGAQIQQRVLNDHMAAFFDVPEFREYLRKRRGAKQVSGPSRDRFPGLEVTPDLLAAEERFHRRRGRIREAEPTSTVREEITDVAAAAEGN